MNISAQDVINAIFHPDDTVCLRIFDDRKEGIFTGAKMSVEAGKFFAVESTLKEHNQKNHGIFFVVNSGGQTDDSITRINAQFVEMDDKSFAEQQALINAFPLSPSMVIQTRKSLHTYWFVKEAKVSLFRPIQKALVQHFGGDPACVNESRVMRLPGFYHCKKEPVLVECISFHPERRYTQEQLIERLPVSQEAEEQPKVPLHGEQKGIGVVEAECDFIKYCRDNAAALSEHDWYAMISNLSVFEGGAAVIHQYSKPYPKYSFEETQNKIQHFLRSGTKPMTCRTIAEKGFSCPKLRSGQCSCKSPAALCFQPLSIDGIRALLQQQKVQNAVVEDLQTARNFVSEYLYNVDSVTAESMIHYDLKQHFGFKNADVKPLLALQKELYKAFQNKSETRKHRSGMEIPDWYEMTERGPKFLPGVLAEYMTQNAPVFYSAEQYYCYENGVYHSITELTARNMVRDKMLTRYTKLSQINDTEGQWKMQVQKDIRELNPNPYLINVRNGLYNVLDETLSEHTAKYLSTVQLNVRYMSDAKCPRFLQFLHESVEEDQVTLIQEMLGYFLIPVNHAQKCFIIVGKGGAGKSVLLRVLNELLLGKENVSNVAWQALNDRFKTAELFGKWANICAELPTKGIEDNGIFKALVGEDYLTVEKKNKNPFSFQPYARLLFSCNSIPKNYGDKSEGFYRRLIIVRFNHSVPEERRDPELLEKFRCEADGIFQFALEGLQRLMQNHFHFSETQANAQELQKYREDSNSVLAFVRDCCTLQMDAEVGRMEFFARYKSYCDSCGMAPYSQQNFNNELEANFPTVVKAADRTGKRRTWRGISFSESHV